MGGGPAEDYYAVLGIDATTGEEELRRVWRRLAREFHPDRAGIQATPTFRKILAAYTVLSDPVARAAYDRRRNGSAAVPSKSSRPTAPRPPSPPRRTAPAVMLRRLCGPLNSLLATGVARRAEDDAIELLLNGREASDGGMVVISMRVPVRCPACADEPRVSCERCAGTRAVEEVFSAWLAVPPGVADGALLDASALLPGMLRPPVFRVRRRDEA